MAPRTAFSILVVLALAAAVTVMVSTSLYGPGMTTVAGDYLFAARSLTQGNGFVQQDGSLYLDYPPLFPIVLAPAVALGVDPAVAARWFNAVCLALIVFLPSLWLLRHLRWRALAIFGGCIFLVSLPLLDVAVMAFPEPLLVLLVLLTLWALWRYAECGRRGWYLTAAMLAALCCLTRYLGAGVILAGAVVVLVSGGQRAGRRLINAIGFGFLALLPTALWFFRNAIVSSSAWGDRAAASVTLAHNIFLAFNMMTSWFMPERVPTPLRIGVLALACGLLGVWVVRRGLRHA
ncbi:MAG TPA: glycosyltransferase family 39 protein, partial [Candidatus Krumholzibacteria bacterium]|nr:glycosyltransferase family 39 protein [Candidatus Krumholzibacteria bacterium]